MMKKERDQACASIYVQGGRKEFNRWVRGEEKVVESEKWKRDITVSPVGW